MTTGGHSPWVSAAGDVLVGSLKIPLWDPWAGTWDLRESVRYTISKVYPLSAPKPVLDALPTLISRRWLVYN